VTLKVAGRFTVAPDTGQVVITFANFPQLPIGHLDLQFKGGDRGLLTTPSECGTYRSTYDLLSWSGASARGSSEFPVEEGCDRGRSSARFHAGSTRAVGGAFTSLLVQLVQGPGSDPVRRMAVTLPPGLVANLKGVPQCPDAALATGARPPECPVDSQVGSVVVGSGSGLPVYLPTGAVYLAGPYRGAPLSLALWVPAVVGPFDLGNLLVRVAVSVDPATAQVRAISDPIPPRLDGVPLELRDVRLLIDRAGFMINPTSCDEATVTGAIGGDGGPGAALSDRFQLGDCAALSFKPRLRVSFGGEVRRNGHPSLRTVLKPRAAGANLASVALELPPTELLDVGHIQAVCDPSEARGGCPPGSRLGHATVSSPILAAPLQGPIYLHSSRHSLPDLVADLHGPFDLTLDGRIGYSHGALAVSFPELPDVPISKATFVLAGGTHGLLVNSESLCAGAPSASARVSAHNGRARGLRAALRVHCGKGSAGNRLLPPSR
jgi:hypothetical protein